MAFPSKARIKKTIKKIEKADGTLAPPPNPTPLEKFRFDLQQKFVVFKNDEQITQKALGEILGIDEGKVSKLLHNRIDEFSTDRLISLYTKINPRMRIEWKVS